MECIVENDEYCGDMDGFNNGGITHDGESSVFPI